MAATGSVRRHVDSQQGLSPQFVLRSLRHWWMVAAPIGLVLAVAGAGVVWWLFEPIYLAKAWIQVRETPPALVFQVESQSKGYVETQKEMIRSARVLRPVVDSANIRNLPELSESEDRVSWLQNQIKLASVGQSEFLRVEFGGPDPENAATIVNAVVKQYFSLLAEVNDERVYARHCVARPRSRHPQGRRGEEAAGNPDEGAHRDRQGSVCQHACRAGRRGRILSPNCRTSSRWRKWSGRCSRRN